MERFLFCFTIFHLNFLTSEALLLDSILFGVPGVKRTLGEVKVQRSDVAAVCENVGVATSSHPGNHCSHCCYSSRCVTHEDPVLLLAHMYWKTQHHPRKRTNILNNSQMGTLANVCTSKHRHTQLCIAIQGWRKVNNERGRLIKQTPHWNPNITIVQSKENWMLMCYFIVFPINIDL